MPNLDTLLQPKLQRVEAQGFGSCRPEQPRRFAVCWGTVARPTSEQILILVT